MSNFDPVPIVYPLFNRLRRDGFNLGVDEYLAVLKTIDGDCKPETEAALKAVLKLLWCSSVDEQSYLETIWDTIVANLPKPDHQAREVTESDELSDPNPQIPMNRDEDIVVPPSNQADNPPRPRQNTPQLSPLPFRTPLTLVEQKDDLDLNSELPVSRRYMVYSWHYLRRSIADGIPDVLDVNATVEKTAKQGFFLQPVFKRRQKNHAHLLLLIDREGSMTPFHHFTNDLVTTAQFESTIEKVDVGYFHNVPTESIYQDTHLNKPIAFETLLSQCDDKTSVLIVSDAGAARGYRRLERIQATTEILFEIQEYTNSIAWLNPMPRNRWGRTSAKIISQFVPMYHLNNEGLTQAIATIQGKLF